MSSSKSHFVVSIYIEMLFDLTLLLVNLLVVSLTLEFFHIVNKQSNRKDWI